MAEVLADAGGVVRVECAVGKLAGGQLGQTDAVVDLQVFEDIKNGVNIPLLLIKVSLLILLCPKFTGPQIIARMNRSLINQPFGLIFHRMIQSLTIRSRLKYFRLLNQTSMFRYFFILKVGFGVLLFVLVDWFEGVVVDLGQDELVVVELDYGVGLGVYGD